MAITAPAPAEMAVLEPMARQAPVLPVAAAVEPAMAGLVEAGVMALRAAQVQAVARAVTLILGSVAAGEATAAVEMSESAVVAARVVC